MLPHVVCGRRVLDEREEGGKALQTICRATNVLIGSTFDRTLVGFYFHTITDDSMIKVGIESHVFCIIAIKALVAEL